MKIGDSFTLLRESFKDVAKVYKTEFAVQLRFWPLIGLSFLVIPLYWTVPRLLKI